MEQNGLFIRVSTRDLSTLQHAYRSGVAALNHAKIRIEQLRQEKQALESQVQTWSIRTSSLVSESSDLRKELFKIKEIIHQNSVSLDSFRDLRELLCSHICSLLEEGSESFNHDISFDGMLNIISSLPPGLREQVMIYCPKFKQFVTCREYRHCFINRAHSVRTKTKQLLAVLPRHFQLSVLKSLLRGCESLVILEHEEPSNQSEQTAAVFQCVEEAAKVSQCKEEAVRLETTFDAPLVPLNPPSSDDCDASESPQSEKPPSNPSLKYSDLDLEHCQLSEINSALEHQYCSLNQSPEKLCSESESKVGVVLIGRPTKHNDLSKVAQGTLGSDDHLYTSETAIQQESHNLLESVPTQVNIALNLKDVNTGNRSKEIRKQPTITMETLASHANRRRSRRSKEKRWWNSLRNLFSCSRRSS